jgi:hypothetical protein
MADQFFIGHSNQTSTQVLRNNLRWTLTAGQFSTDQQIYCNQTTDRKEKRKSPRFAFLKISASAHCTHLQSRTSQPTAQTLQKSAILAEHCKTT